MAKEMKCNCGKKLIPTGIFLSKEDELDWQLAIEQEATATQAMSLTTLNKLKFSDGEMYEYVIAASELLAKAKFLISRLLKKIPEKYNIDDNFKIINGEIFIHAATEENKHGHA